jgi:hypothetical protein
MRWPNSWTSPAALDLLKGSAIDFLIAPDVAALERVRARAKELGIRVAASAPAGVTLAEGSWPGIKLSREGGDRVDTGPTGAPWVDSNGWLVSLTRAQHAGSAVWVDAPPKDRPRFTAASYLLAMADTGAYGGRWIVSLDDRLATGVAAGNSDALTAWKRIAAASGFFAAHHAWDDYTPESVVGVVSDFTGKNEFFGRELLNLLARAGRHYRVILKDKPAFGGLRAILYADEEPPSNALRQAALAFVEAGGLLITGPQWGEAPGKPMAASGPLQFSIRAIGKGRMAVAAERPDDPYVLAGDAAVLISHRYDLVRCWNAGASGSSYAVSPDRKQALVHLLFYADRGPTEASVRIAGRFSAVRMSTADHPASTIDAQFQKDAVEVHLPQVPPHVALELTYAV